MALATVPQVDVLARRVHFDWLDHETDQWHHSLPEFGAAANAVSLLMPHAEPYVISKVRTGLSSLPNPSPQLTDTVDTWIKQEGAHFKAHRDFNRSLTATSRTARALDRLGSKIFSFLDSRSDAFGLAFAAAFEIIAFCAARWAEAGLRRYFAGADERAATLFLWHLAEEIEHKGIAHDVMAEHPEATKNYKLAALVAFTVMIGFTIVGGLALFARRRSVLNPVRWARLIGWGFSFAFVVLPVVSSSVARDFHPDDLVDPPWMAQWLLEFDPETQTLPLWTDAGLSPRAATIDQRLANQSAAS